jgi:uncharacterized protein (TIGR03435 family)
MLTHLLDVSARSLLLALIAESILITLRRWRTAALEHAIWTAVVCAMLALFAFGSALPNLPLPVIPSAAGASAAMDRTRSSISTTPMRFIGEVEMPVIIPSKPHRPVDWGTAALAAYAVIALVFVVRFFTGLFLARRLVAKSTPVQGFRESELIAVPCTVGCFRPEIVLPLEWRQWDQAKLNTVLEHEGSHVRRHDALVAALAVINRCVFWFHPLAWWLERRLGMLAEIACDDSCVAKMGDPQQYARLLLQMTRLVERPLGRLRKHALTMAAGSHLAQRIELIHQEGRTFSRGLSWTGWAAIGMCGLPVMLGAGTVQLQRQTPFLLPMPPAQRFTTPPPPPPFGQRMLLAQAEPIAVAPKPGGRVEFEVASIRPTAVTRGVTGVPGRGGEAPPPPPPGGPECAPVSRRSIDAGRIDLVCISLKQLLLEAFAIPSGLLAAPDWTETDAFDISAKLPNGTTKDQFPEMLQSLLEDRFRLTFHRRAKEGVVNALVVAKGGVKVKPAAPESAQPAWVAAAAAVSGPYGSGNIGGIRFRSIAVPNSDGALMSIWETPSMGFVRRSNTGGPGGIIWHYEAPSMTFDGLADLAVIAGNGLDPAVVDMTGLKGRYQVNLDISMADLIAAIAEGPREPATLQNAQLSVVQDGLKKLGLQLETRKASVDVIVIDHLEKTPTAN